MARGIVRMRGVEAAGVGEVAIDLREVGVLAASASGRNAP
jgi:hypothetical protein